MAAVIHAACQATVPSVRSLGRKMPLRLRVCGRSTGAVDVEGAAEEGLEDINGEDPAVEGLGDGDSDDPVNEGLGETEPEPAVGVTGVGLPGEGGSPGEADDDGEAGVGLGDGGAGQVRGEAGPAAGGDAARGVEGTSGERAWARGPRPCRGAARSTCASDGVGDGGTGASRISKRAPRPVPAPWLGNNTGEYATSSNWSGAMEDECKEGDSLVEIGSLAKGKTCSSNTTSREI
jgi:hypothetical protein